MVKEAGEVRVSVYNIVGERIADVLTLKAVAGQSFAAAWDGKNLRGELVGNGLYLVVLRGPAGVVIQKVVVLK